MSDGELKKFNIDLATLDDDVDCNYVETQYEGIKKISFILLEKWMVKDEQGNKQIKKDPTILTYNRDVISFFLEDSLESIGVNGYIDFNNSSSNLVQFLGKIENYFIILNITECMRDGDKMKHLYKYEPYIFVATSSQTLTPVDTDNKIIRVFVEDYFTNILRTHSFISLLQFNSSILEITNYKDFFSYVLDYVKSYVKENSFGAYEYHKDLLYDSEMLIGGGIKNGNDTGTDMNLMIQNSIGKLSPSCSIYEAVIQMYMDCCTTMKSTDAFASENQVISDLLIPFFFKEEYADGWGMYYRIWGNTTTDEVQVQGETPIVNQDKDNKLLLSEGRKCPLVLRNMTMRDMYMPFHLAFGVSGKCCVYETINSPSEQEKNCYSLNGYYKHEISSMQFIPIDTSLLKKINKNMIIIEQNIGGGAGGSAALIFYSWLFDFYQRNFLNCDVLKKDTIEYRIPNHVPNFLANRRSNGVVAQTSEENKFDMMNSYIFQTETEDSLGETMRIVGKNLAALILCNESYRFRLRGNMLRRPNEIIKFVYETNGDSSQKPYSMFTGLSLPPHMYLYVKSVGHHFSGNQYWNYIHAGKIAEVFTK